MQVPRRGASRHRRSTLTRVGLPFLLVALVATGAPVYGPATAAVATASAVPAALPAPLGEPAPDQPCYHDAGDPGWAPSTTSINTRNTYHPYVGNGYLGHRVPPAGMGYLPLPGKSGFPLYTPRYDGALVAGLYAHNPQTATNRQVIAAIPAWTTLDVGAGPDTFTATTPASRITKYRQTLFFRCGLLRTTLTWTSRAGRSTDLSYDVIADRTNEHVGAVQMTMVPHWSGQATVTDRIDGAGARRLVQTGGGDRGGSPVATTVDVTFRTDGTAIDGAVASTLRPGPAVHPSTVTRSRRAANLSANQAVTFPVRSGQAYQFVKYVGVDTKLTSPRPESAALSAARHAAERRWPALLAHHAALWKELWRGDIEVPGRTDIQTWARSSRYGLLSNIRQRTSTSIAPAGLTSDDYAGLIFWDAETWMFPALLATNPDIAAGVLEYRYRTMPAARANARQLGYRGLFYPWTSASMGDLDTECHSWEPPHCLQQIHLQSDISLAAWQQYLATGDTSWLRSRGWPLLRGIAEFWASRVTRNADGSYSINGVAGPDEYANNVNDGVFTNAGAAVALRNATKAARILGEPAPPQWTTIADHLRILYDADRQIFIQYQGYDGRTIKQADAVLLIYPLEWPMSRRAAANTLSYYAARTDPAGPAMTDSVQAIASAFIGESGCTTYRYLLRSSEPFVRPPFALFSESRGETPGGQDRLAGTPAQDFLTGKGGFLQVFTYGLAGLRWRADRVHLDPTLPSRLSAGVRVKDVHWQGRTFDIAIGPDATTVRLTSGKPFPVESRQGTQVVSGSAPAVLKTRRPDPASAC